MNNMVKGILLTCPFCESHPNARLYDDNKKLFCELCGRAFEEWDGKPCFLDDNKFPNIKLWKEPFLKPKIRVQLLKKRLASMLEKLRAPRVRLRRLPHIELLNDLNTKSDFNALYIGYNQPFKPEMESKIIQLNVIPGQYVDVVSMGEYLPFPDNSFDLVVISQVIEHTQYPFKVIEDCHRVLCPEAKIYISSPWVYPFHGGDNYRFSYEGLKILCNKFDIFEIGSLNGPIHALAIFLQYLITKTLSIGNRYLTYFLGIVTSWIVFPLTLIDALFNRKFKKDYTLDANIYIIAAKKAASECLVKNQ
jgi:SAM-dependent methyltransferase/uncharacterized protein YbaR (Trm112 family)